MKAFVPLLVAVSWLILLYETAALIYDRLPTITAVSRSHPVTAWLLIAALSALHVWAVAHLTNR